MSKVSVIIPFYNTADYFEKCLNSIVNQTLKDIEIILIDDGSTDNSLEIAKKFQENDSRIKIIEQNNKKQGAARNAGMQLATGEYIGFIDSDDWVDLDYFEKLYNSAKKFDSDIALATNVRIGNGKTKTRLNITEQKFVTSFQDKVDINNQAKNPCPTNKIYRLSMLKNNNIKWQENVYYEDKLFTIQAIFYANGVVSTPNIYYYYFRNPNSTVNHTNKEFIAKRKIDKNKARLEVINFLRNKKADVKDKQFWAIEKEIKIFNIPILTKNISTKTVEYRLFSAIPIISKNNNTQ